MNIIIVYDKNLNLDYNWLNLTLTPIELKFG